MYPCIAPRSIKNRGGLSPSSIKTHLPAVHKDKIGRFLGASVSRGELGRAAADANEIVEPGVYQINNGNSLLTNMPTGAYAWGVLIVSSSSSISGNYARQQVYHDNHNNIWARELWGSSTSAWNPWIRIDNFGCNTLAELKAALASV